MRQINDVGGNVSVEDACYVLLGDGKGGEELTEQQVQGDDNFMGSSMAQKYSKVKENFTRALGRL